MIELLPILHDTFLQIYTNSTTAAAAGVTTIPQQVSTNTSEIAALVGTTVATVGGLVGKHLYDTKKRGELLNTASDIDRMQMTEIADNYNDFSKGAMIQEEFIRLLINNPDLKISDILNMISDDVTKETIGMKMVRYYEDIQKYNTEYYQNTAFKANAMLYNSKNPLKNVRNMVRDMAAAAAGSSSNS